MSEEFSFEVKRYEGPEYLSFDRSCNVCRKPLKVRILDGLMAITCKWDWNKWSENGVEVEEICEDCSYALMGLEHQIFNYNNTGDPNDDSWRVDEE